MLTLDIVRKRVTRQKKLFSDEKTQSLSVFLCVTSSKAKYSELASQGQVVEQKAMKAYSLCKAAEAFPAGIDSCLAGLAFV